MRGAPLSGLLLLAARLALAQGAPPPPAIEPAASEPTPAERERRLEELREAVEAYEAESREYRRDIQELVERGVRRRRGALEAAYEKQLRELESLERKERLDAIAQAEAFLARYPEHPRYTPEVMFRLAELLYERSSDDHLLALRDLQAQLEAGPPPPGAPLPREPQVDFSPSIALYRTLLARYPGFRDIDGAQYLLAYCLEKQGEAEAGLAEYQRLLSRFPKSRFVTETWLRIGEHFFDADVRKVPDALERAARAYEAAARDTAHPLHDKALYKLGWTHYRQDRFADAVSRFLALVDLYEARAQARGEAVAGGDLREEALQYVAISLTDEAFSGTPAAHATLAGLAGKPYEAELLKRTGDVLFELTRHEEAVRFYRRALERAPLRPDAPDVQARIVQAYERERRMEEALAETERLASTYGAGSAWRAHNRRNADVLAHADRLAEEMLAAAALFHHQQALAHKQAGREEESRPHFARAARAWAAVVQRFPRSKAAYERGYYLAECLSSAHQPAEAAAAYEAVRDSTAGGRYRVEAAYAAVLSWQQHLDEEVRAGRVADVRPRTAAERPAGERPRPLPLTAPEQRLVAASDAFLAAAPGDARSAGVAYKAAERLFAHDAFPEARRRLEALILAFPAAQEARFATHLLVETYVAEGDWAGLEEASGRLAHTSAAIPAGSPLHQELVGFALTGRFKHADQLLASGKPAEAAQKYLALVDEAPGHDYADEALNNAAVACEAQRRFDAARQLYERLARDYPASPLADGALFRAAVDAERSYDLDGAVERYQRLVRDFPAARDREAALSNAARLLEAQQRFAEAAATFLQAAELFPASEEAPAYQERAARALEAQGDVAGAIAAREAFLQRFAARPAQAERAVDVRRRLGDAWQRLGRTREAQAAWAAAAAEYERRGLTPEAHPLAADAASAARFALGEAEREAFERLAISGQGKALVRSLTAKKDALKRAADAYAQVFAYKRLEWILAAQSRRGLLLQRYAATLVDTPVPAEVRQLGEDAVVAYQETIASEAAQYEELAVQAYTATLEVAQQNGLVTGWTRRTREALHQLRPDSPLPEAPQAQLLTEAPVPDALPAVAALLAQGKVEAAAVEARSALAQGTGPVHALRMLAQVYLRAQRPALAQRALEDARELAPQDAAVHHALGLVQLQQGARAEAKESFRRAAQLRPDFAEARSNLGALLNEEEAWDAALPELEAAVAATPTLAAAHLNLGNAYRGKGEVQKALLHYQQALQLQPERPDAAFNLALLHLEAPVPGQETEQRLEAAIRYLEASRAHGGDAARVEASLREARRALERERRRLERERQESLRQAPPPAPEQPALEQPAPSVTSSPGVASDKLPPAAEAPAP